MLERRIVVSVKWRHADKLLVWVTVIGTGTVEYTTGAGVNNIVLIS